MSVEYEVKVSSKTIQEFDTLLAEWTTSYERKNSAPVKVTPLIQPDRFYIFGAGSIRGFTLSPADSFFKGGRVEVRLNVMSSRDDWRLCYYLLEKMIREQHGLVSDENGRKLSLSDLSPAKAQQRGQEAVQADLRYLQHFLQDGGEPFLRLPNPNYDLLITRAESSAWNGSAKGVLEFEQTLSARAARLAFCRHASLVALKDGLTINAIGFEPAVYPASDYAGLHRSTTPPLHSQPGDLRFVTFGKFLEAFKDRIERVKEYPPGYYLGGIDLDNPDDLAAHTHLLQIGLEELPRKG